MRFLLARALAHCGWCLVVGAALSPEGCATAPASPPIHPVAANVALIDGTPIPPFRRLREVQATSCAVDLGEEPIIGDAREGLKIEAARVGANAVGTIICDVELAQAGSACWKIARCTGEAECVPRSTNPQIVERCE